MKNVNKVALIAVFALSSSLGFSQVAFSVVKVPGSSANSPISVNDSGQVLVNTGSSNSSQVSTWSRANGSQAVALVTTNSGGTDIDNAGDIVGAGDPDDTGNLQAFLWQANTGTRWLGTFGGDWGVATAVNDAGAVVGEASTAAGSEHAFLWTQANGMQDLTPDVNNKGGAEAMAINDSNEVVGFYFPNGSYKTVGFTWTQAGGLQELGPAGTIALGINDSGTVVGQMPVASGYNHAFSWTAAGGFVDLGSLGGMSSAFSINNGGWVVGNTLATSGKGYLHGFLWTPSAGMQDFTTLAGLTYTEQIYSAQVNDLGVIAISTSKGGYLLLPKVTGKFSSSANPSTVGQPVTFTANLSSIAGPPPDGETVQFLVGTKVVGTATLHGGIAQFTTSTITAGSHAIAVNYGGDVSHLAIKFAALTQVVNK